MWICLPHAFLSIVQAPRKPHLLAVRARRRADLTALFPGRKVYTWADRDYRHRVFAPRHVVADVLRTFLLDSLTYGNFKDATKDRVRHDAYFNVWRNLLVLDDAPVDRRVGRPEQHALDLGDGALSAPPRAPRSRRLGLGLGAAYGAARDRSTR